jgi:predicted RNase H-like HicB family nuclease
VSHSNDIIPAQLMTELTLTAIYEEAEEGGYIGYVAELPGANTQGETLEEVRENLGEAIQLILEANREEFEKNFSTNAKVTRERLVLRAAYLLLSEGLSESKPRSAALCLGSLAGQA